MNVNENAPVFGRGRGKGRQLKVLPIQRTLMGPPTRPAPKRKGSNSTPFTPSSSSNIHWRNNQKSSTQNNSTTARTSISSRSTTEPESRVVIALSEGRGEAVGEVGIAAINIARPCLILCQISDSQSYINTLTKINILNPSEILVPLTFIESFTSNRLIEKVKEQFPDVTITGVTRITFNKSTGLQYVKKLCMPSMNSIVIILQHRYYALAAAAALLTYTETALYITYAWESLKIEYQESEGSTIIDVATADRLELVSSARPTMKKRFSCLLDVLNHCLTKIGARTLRASILQPPCSVPDIEARLDCVTEIVEHADMLAAIQVALSKLANIDQLLTLATVLPDQAQNCSERQINYILLLNTVLEQVSPLHDIFENSTQSFFVELRTTLGNPAFAEIKDLVQTLIHTDAHPGKGQYGMYQRCFAIKPGINSLLDLVRKSYSERLDDMRKYVTTLGERYSLAMVLHNNHKKGYHILLNLNANQKKTLKKNDLPPECIQVERLANSYTMKTQELITLANQIEDIMAEILKMSNIMIHKLLIQIREHIGIFYKLCEDIAKLDMFQSLAKASSAIQYVRPQFSSYLEVIQARHPLLDFLCSTEPSANSMYASKEYNINIITGPNGSGKSIFVRQVILLQVMAQVGCYVPAQSATLRASDRILARVYLEDNMDCGASAFVLEMKEIQYFLTVLTENSLIIIDELCRSTSVEEGTALAMAVCEKLMQTSAFVFFTTHFKFLTKLQDLHFGVKTWQLETLTETIDNQMVLRFTYNVVPGVTSLEHYGIFLAKGSWPETIIKYAEEILKNLSTSHKQPSPRVEGVSTAARMKYDFEAELQMLKAKKQLNRTKINEKLTEYQRNLGHQVYILLLSDQTNNNQLSVYDGNNNYNAGTEVNHNEANPLLQTNFEHFLNEPEECSDYLNLQGQNQNFDTSDISHIDQIMVNPPMQNLSIRQNRNIFENLHDENPEIPPFFNCQSNVPEMEGFIQESIYPPVTGSHPCNASQQIFFQNNQASTAPQQYYTSYSDNTFTLNDSAISERLAHLENTERNESLSRSFANLLEPEIILETDELEVNVSNAQKSFVFHKKSTVVGQQTLCLSKENMIMTSIQRNASVSQELSYMSEENYFLSREFVESRSAPVASGDGPVPPGRAAIRSRTPSVFSQENSSIYEDAMSDYFDSESVNIACDNNNMRQLSNANESKMNDESLKSITEQQFSFPLLQDVKRSSTPVNLAVKSPTQPIPMWNQTNWSNASPASNKLAGHQFKEYHLHTSISRATDQINAAHSIVSNPNNLKKSGTHEYQPKSDSIKWIAPNQKNPPIWNETNWSNPSPGPSRPDRLQFIDSHYNTSEDASFNSAIDEINKTHSVVSPNNVKKSGTHEQQPKSDSTKSDSIKWIAPNQKNAAPILDQTNWGNPSPGSSKPDRLQFIDSYFNTSKAAPFNGATDEINKTHSVVSPNNVNKSGTHEHQPKSDSIKWITSIQKNTAPIWDQTNWDNPSPGSSKPDRLQFKDSHLYTLTVSSLDQINTTQSFVVSPNNVKKSATNSKSDTTKSDSIKWITPNQKNTPPIRNQTNRNNLSPGSNSPDGLQVKDSRLHTSKVAFLDQINATQSVVVSPNNVKKSATNSKSDSTKSDSIKWISVNQNNVFATPAVLRTPTSNGPSTSTSPNSMALKVSQGTADKNKQTNTSSTNNTNSKTSTDSIAWNADQKVAKNKYDIESAHNVSNSHYYSEAEITDILIDLQSCSEYFSETEDWDFVDQEVKSKLNQQANISNKTDQIRIAADSTIKNAIENKGTVVIDHSECQYKFQEHVKDSNTHKETVAVEGAEDDLAKVGLDLPKNRREKSKAIDLHGQQCGKKKTAIMQRKRKVSLDTDTKYVSHRKVLLKTKNVKMPVHNRKGTFQLRKKTKPYPPNNKNTSVTCVVGKNKERKCSKIDRTETSQLLDKPSNSKSLHSKESTTNVPGSDIYEQHEAIPSLQIKEETLSIQTNGETKMYEPYQHKKTPQKDKKITYHEEEPSLQTKEETLYIQNNVETKICEPDYHKETLQKDQNITYHGEVHKTSYHPDIQHSQWDEIFAQSNSTEKSYQAQIHRPPCDSETIHEPPSHENTQLDDDVRKTLKLQKLEEKEELLQAHQLNFREEEIHISYDEVAHSQSQCNKEISQMQHERDPSPMRMSWIQKSEPMDENIIHSDDRKSLEYTENADQKDPNNTAVSYGSKNNMSASYQTKTKSSNGSCTNMLDKENLSSKPKQSQDVQVDINRSNPETDINPKCVTAQNRSLEPLGDIHLELFSDESIFDESQNQTGEENYPLKKSPNNGCKNDKSFPSQIDGGSSKIPRDCDDAVQEQTNISPVPQKYVNTTTDEYETAHSTLATSQQDSIFFNTPCGTGPAFTSTPNENKRQQSESSQTDSIQTSKRKKLGYLTKTSSQNPGYLSPIPETTNKPTLTRETSPDIFEGSQQEIYPLYKDASEEMSQTPSDFESSKIVRPGQTVKKSKWVSPLKSNSKISQQKKVLQKNKLCKSAIPKFKPPRKLTKKEIERDFYEQDKKMLESGDSAQYLEQIINRPTVRQLQQAKYIASIHKTSSGVVVVPATECKRKTKKHKFVAPLKKGSDNFDITLFSDKNSDKFQQLMNNSSGKKITNERVDIVNRFIESEVVVKKDNKENVDSRKLDQNLSGKIKVLQDIKLVSASNLIQGNEIAKHPEEGYYIRNKKDIDSIVNKYLKQSTSTANVTTSDSQKKQLQELNSSIFSQTTVLLDIDSLD